MADQAFEVMISDQEYKILKSHQKTNQRFKLQIDDLKVNLKNAQNHSKEIQLTLLKKDTQIAFLLSTIQNFASNNDPSCGEDISTLKSATFQVLGQSVLEPQKAKQRKVNQHNQELMKKHSSLLKQIVSIEQRMESQQELISKLNQINTEKNEALLSKEVTFKKEESGNSSKLQKEIVELKNQVRTLKSECEEQKRQKIEQKLMLEKQKSVIQKENGKMASQIQKQLEMIKAVNKEMSSRIQDSNQRIKDLQMENSLLKQGLGTSTFEKEQTKHKIKGLIDQYVREVEKNLKAIEGLSPQERKQLIQHEMKDIIDYIPKSISNKK